MDYKKYVEELEKMVKIDQELRGAVEPDWTEIRRVDTESTERMKEIIKEIGFPGISKVGEQGSFNAWLLAQHSPELEFKRTYLALMESQPPEEYLRKNYEFLADRITLWEGSEPIFGTQPKKAKTEYE